MVQGFANCVPELREWSCEPPPIVPTTLTMEYVLQRLERSAKRLKRPQLGYSFVAWSGTKEQASGLRVSVGVTSRAMSNRVNLAFPVDLSPNDTTVKCILSALIRVWRPEFAAYNPIYRKEERRFELGEMVFLPEETSSCLGDLSRLRRETFDYGHLYTLTSAEIELLYQQASAADNTKERPEVP
jgi:hypothetical protein